MDSLLENIQQFFLEQYKDLSSTNTFLAFEPLGCVINPEEFKDPATGQYLTVKADEEISEIVDRVPVISDVFIPGLEQVSSQYETLVSSARFNANAVQGADKSDYLALLEDLRSKAQKQLADADRMSLINASGKYFPATTTPDSWYDAGSPIWAFKEFHSDKVVTETPPPDKPNFQKLNFAWKTLDLSKVDPAVTPDTRRPNELFIKLAQVQKEPGIVNVPEPTGPRPTRFHLGKDAFKWHSRIPRGSGTIAKATFAGHLTPPRRDLLPANPAFNKALLAKLNKKSSIALKSDFIRLVLNDRAVTETKPVETSNFNMSFWYCLVQVRRFWLDTKLFNYSKLWYSLAQEEGFFSSGEKDISNKGCLRAIPKAFIIIRDLKISAAWSANDLDAARKSVGLGVFNLMNSTVEGNQLSNPALQIIGWLCEATPKMPATADPNLVV